MISFTNTVTIDRPAAQVFAFLADLRNVPKWNWAVTRTEQLTPGAPGVGARYRQTRSHPRPETEELRIDTLKQDEHLAVEGTLAHMPARLTYDIEEIGSKTRVENGVDLVPPRGAALAVRVLSGSIERAVADNLGQLKLIMESENGPG